ncbi:MAG: putative maltokinase, partial [Pseudomonadota bacterium]|nr:putative maltokinase [Pseudomonadota bacterium]
YGYEAVNVEAQARDPHSLLNWMRRTLAVRRQHQAFGRGAFRLLYPKNRKVLAYLREHEAETLLCVANLSRTPEAVELDLSEFVGRLPVELDGGSIFPPIGQLTYLLTLPPYGFYWFLLAREAEWPSWHTPAPEAMPEYQTIVIRRSLADALATARVALEREILPAYLAVRRWFAAKDQKLRSVRVARLTPLPQTDRELLLAEIETETAAGTSHWLLPLTVIWEDEPPAALPGQLALARVRRGGRVGLLTDGFALPTFARAMMADLAQQRRLRIEDGEIRFEASDRIGAISLPPDADITWLSAEQSNSSLIAGDAAMLKLFRRVIGGPHPEAEMGRYLTEQGYAHIPPLLGEMVRIDADGTRHTLAVVQGFIRNQGDAWNWTLEWLMRGLSDLASADTDDDAAAQSERFAEFEAAAGILGRRLGEMHAVLARPTDNPDFGPERADAETVHRWVEQAAEQLDAAFKAIGAAQHGLEGQAAQDAASLLAARGALDATVRTLAAQGAGALLTRIHGDLHLGQTLVSSADVYIIDFEGEPARPLAQRRAKNSPLRDLAGMIRSVDYAAAVVRRKSNEAHAHLPEERREAFLAAFLERSVPAFLDGYREQAPPGDEAADEALLQLFLIEKAAYEVAYEAANRPAWIDVPVHGLARIVEQALGEERQAADD